MAMITLTVIATLIVIFLEFARRRHSYWRYRGIYSPPGMFILGHATTYTSKSKKFWIFIDEHYQKHKSKEFLGIYTIFTPTLIVLNPKHIRHVLISAFEHFPCRTAQMKANSLKDKVMADFMTNLTGRRWKYIRSKVSPAFSSGKLKGLFPLMTNTSDELIELCDKKMKEDGVIDVADAMNRYVLEVIANVVAGIEGGCLKNEKSEFYTQMAAEIFKVTRSHMVKYLIHQASPRLYELLGLSMTNKAAYQLAEDLKKTIEQRMKSGVKRGDFLDLMIEAKENANESEDDPELAFTMDTTAAQSLIFLLAGYHTTSSSLTFVMYLLATHQEEQRLLREEIVEKTADEKFTYTNVMEATYLDACLNECQRLYPHATLLSRYCENSFHIPESSVIVQKGHSIIIPTYSLHHDPEYWPEPDKFQPSRFLPENKSNIEPNTYLPFGLGPRACVAPRFAMMEMKIVMCKILQKYEIKLQPGFEMEFSSGQSMKVNENGMKVILTEVQK